MIQRIQTIYLLLAAVTIALLFFVPYGGVVPELDNLPEMIKNKSAITPLQVQDNPFSMVLAILTAVVSLVTIFLYNNRTLQMNICLVNLGLITALLVTLLGVLYKYEQNFINSDLENFKIGLLLPVIALIFTYLAYRGVKKDEQLVRSADRFY